ncbi:MAG: hypothetical protein ABI723_22060 [Bacteroidia bacterium]
MTTATNFKISSYDTNDTWTKLNLADNNSADWDKAVKIFKDRFETRFFKPLNALIKHQDEKIKFYSGFTVLAIDCLLIETFNQFYHGIDESEDKFKRNCKTFKDIFKRSDFFKNDFDTDEKISIFYKHIRCGLLHQGETKEDSKINLKKSDLITIIENNGVKSIELNRREFHKRVTAYFEDYSEKLKDIKQTDLRKNFKLKMDLITRRTKPKAKHLKC